MKRIQFLGIAILSLLILAAVAGMRRVASDEQAVLVRRNGSVKQVGPGWQFVGPGVELVKYPVGEWHVRVPASGTAPVTLMNGSTSQVSFEYTLTVPPGTAESLYTGFSMQFEPAIQKLVTDAAEIEAAAHDDATSSAYVDAVRRRVAGAMEKFGIRLGDPGGSRTSAAPRRLIIVGVDGGDWLNLRPLIDAGKLPHFATLVRDGATGPLRSEEPMLSPLLWTTMATGRLPEQHGILNFTVVDPKTGERAPVSRLQRKVDAFWNMLGDYNRSVAVIGWLATDPAEAVDGVMVTDKFGYLAYIPENTDKAEDTSVYPPSRRPELASLVVHAEDVSDDDLARFVHVPRNEMAKHRRGDDPNDPREPPSPSVRLHAHVPGHCHALAGEGSSRRARGVLRVGRRGEPPLHAAQRAAHARRGTGGVRPLQGRRRAGVHAAGRDSR